MTWRHHFLSILVLASLPLTVTVSGAAPQSVERIIIKWRDVERGANIAVERVQALGDRNKLALARGRTIGGGMSVVLMDRRRRGAELQTVLAALRADPAVELAEPDRRMRIQAYVPNDPLFAGQWYLQSAEAAALKADAAWDLTRGGDSPAASTVVVAVLDTGVRLDHPDLAGKLLPGFDFVSGITAAELAVANDGNGWDADPSDPGDFLSAADLASDAFRDSECGAGANQDQPVDSSWHGTRVSGMIAASTDNAQGIAGTGFNIRVLPVRVLGKCGGFESDVLAGMYWAAGLVVPPPLLQQTNLGINPNPAQIINMSLGGEGACSASYATAVRDITEHGVLVVASAGNEGTAVGTPASCAGVLAVTGVRHIGTKVGYSNLGPEAGIAAPAGNCVNVGANEPCLFSLDTTTNDGLTGPGSNIYTDQLLRPNFGTSFASPLAAGAAGLMKSVNPALTPALLIARIRSTAAAFPASSDSIPAPPVCQLPASVALQGAECICTTQVCGAGLLNAEAAVNAALRPAVLVELLGTVGPGRTVTLDGSRSGVAVGRSVASFAWTVESTSNGAATPLIQNSDRAQAMVVLPSQGTTVFGLTVTDNQGASDSAQLTVTVIATGGTGGSTSPPPSVSTNTGGGGGGMGLVTMLLALLLTYTHQRRRRNARSPRLS
jgi:serine protease